MPVETVSPPAPEPLVSVILPVYNGEQYVGLAIQSALQQTYRNIEVIVIDDGSTDETGSVLKAYAAADQRIRVIQQPNSGVARARNRAIAEAHGEFVAPLDADDLWEPTKIERQVRRMQQAGEDTGLVYCWWVWIDKNGRVLDRSPRWEYEGQTLETLLQVNFTGNGSVPLYRRTSVEAVGGYDESLEPRGGRGCEDWDLALRIASLYRLAVAPAILVGYRRLPGSMSTQCEIMWRSRELVTQQVRHRHPDLTPASFQRSSDQFALYLAGVLFRSGAYFRAAWWTLFAWRSGLLFMALPYILGLLVRQLDPRRRPEPEVMAPGRKLNSARIGEPLIPYHRIYGHPRYGLEQPEQWGDASGKQTAGTSTGGRAAACLRSRALQVALVVVAFLLTFALHANDDGLWFQGDAPRHGANGFFWWDLIAALPADPADFAIRYYARYPFINPIAYPPLFYLLEGFAFHVFAPSPLVAKLIVLAFGIMAGVYTMAWARRWLTPEAGWAGAFLAFVPSIVLWTNAVMLNIPAMAFGLGCLYHWRSWLQTGGRKDSLTACIFGAAAVLTYYQGGIALGICVVWELLFRRYRGLRWRRYWLAGIGLCVLIPLLMAARVAPLFAERNLPTLAMLARVETWAYYFLELPELLGPVLPLLGVAGLAAGLRLTRWRTEAVYAGSWIGTPIIALSILPAKDARYMILVAPAFVIAAAIGIAAVLSLFRRPRLHASLLFMGFLTGMSFAAAVRVPYRSGFWEIAQFLKENGPRDAVLYDGYHDGLFGFYVRALDPNYDRRVMLGQHLLYHYGPRSTFDWVETLRASTTQEVVDLLRNKSGCRWVAIEVGPNSEWAAGQRLLRQAVARPEFSLVRSFPVVATGAKRIDLYRLAGPVLAVETVDLELASYRTRRFECVVPIRR